MDAAPAQGQAGRHDGFGISLVLRQHRRLRLSCLLRKWLGFADDPDDPSELATRSAWSLIEMLGNDDRISATAMQTVSPKGCDGFTIAVVRGADR